MMGNALKFRGTIPNPGLMARWLILALLALFSPVCMAQESAPAVEATFDPFLVRNVPVDVTAASVTEARERGLTQGRVTAFRRLVERMTLRENWAAITAPDAVKIIDMVLEFSVANEKSSAVRYLADLSVRFDPAAIRAFLRAQNIPFAETASRPLIVVPLVQSGGGVQLWQDDDPWRAAWAAILPHDGLIPIVLPLGDLADIGMLSADQAAVKDRDALMKLATKYGAVGAVIARATPSGDSLSIAVTELRALGEPFETLVTATIAGADEGAKAKAMSAAAIESLRPLEDRWKQQNTLRFGTGGTLTALIPVTSLQDWLAIKARLARVPVVEKVELEAISKVLVQVRIAYAGEDQQLQFAMSQNELDLKRDGDMWLLRAPTLHQTTPPPAQ
jgi:hypothetical protein